MAWIAGILLFAIVLLVTTFSSPDVTGASPLFAAYGLGAVALFAAIYAVCTGSDNPLRLAMGDDGKLSTSKLQFLVWTLVFVYCYVMLESARIDVSHHFDGINLLPRNALIAMGLSVTTAVGASAIVSSQVQSGASNKTSLSSAAMLNTKVRLSDAIVGDAGYPDLAKMQMLTWTVISAVIYIALAHTSAAAFATCDATKSAADGGCSFPDIDAALMVLMGLGQGAYLGGKVVSTDSPRVSSMNPPSGTGGTSVTLSGDDFGDTLGRIRINGAQSWDPTPVTWSDKQITFTIPANATTGPWKQGDSLAITVVTAAQAETDPVHYTIQLQR